MYVYIYVFIKGVVHELLTVKQSNFLKISFFLAPKSKSSYFINA